MKAVRSHRGHVNDTALVAACIGLAACSSACLRWASDRPDAALVVPLLLVWGLFATGPALNRTPASLRTVLLSATAVRLLLVGTPPLLSDDVFRYVFEGLALGAGHNPFLTPPSALPELADGLAARVNHPDYTSIYPPVALLWFRLLALGGSIAWAQLATACLDVATTGALWRLLSRRGSETWPALVYALHPLPAVEAAVGAHLDLVAAHLLVLALAWPRYGTALATLGGGVKLLPAVLLPAFWRTGSPRAHLAGFALAACVLLAGAAPVLDAGSALFTSFSAYANHWSFNGLAYPLVLPLLGSWTRPVLVASGAGWTAYALWRRRDPAEVALDVGAALLFLSPTVHPWYAIWALVPSLALGRWGWSLAATSLMGSYAVLATLDPVTGAWQEGPWVSLVSWGPALAALGAERLTSRREPR